MLPLATGSAFSEPILPEAGIEFLWRWIDDPLAVTLYERQLQLACAVLARR